MSLHSNHTHTPWLKHVLRCHILQNIYCCLDASISQCKRYSPVKLNLLSGPSSFLSYIHHRMNCFFTKTHALLQRRMDCRTHCYGVTVSCQRWRANIICVVLTLNLLTQIYCNISVLCVCKHCSFNTHIVTVLRCIARNGGPVCVLQIWIMCCINSRLFDTN